MCGGPQECTFEVYLHLQQALFRLEVRANNTPRWIGREERIGVHADTLGRRLDRQLSTDLGTESYFSNTWNSSIFGLPLSEIRFNLIFWTVTGANRSSLRLPIVVPLAIDFQVPSAWGASMANSVVDG
jgi:hypothetical protein